MMVISILIFLLTIPNSSLVILNVIIVILDHVYVKLQLYYSESNISSERMQTEEITLGIKLKIFKVMVMKICLPLHATKRIIKFRMKRWRPRLLEYAAIMKCELLGKKLQAILMLLLV